MEYSKLRLRSFTMQEPYCILHCGSHYELPFKYTITKLSDVDVLFYCYDICAIPWSRNPPKNTRCTILRIDSTETPSGYARLKVHGAGKNKTSYYRRPRMLADVESGGASMSIVEKYFPGAWELFKIDCGDIGMSMDRVFAIYCPYWPVEAEEWRKRKRFNGWPDEKLIARITRGGCHFVSKLRTCDDTEWRFSFSKAELLLIHSWTDVQKIVYHSIRLIRKSIPKHLVGHGNKGFQTYYFKTLMFWACEEFPPEYWSEHTNTCVQTLFLRFHKCLNEKFCPNYFIPECNIMSHLKDEDGYQTGLDALLTFVANRNLVFADKVMSGFHMWWSFEFLCIQTTRASFSSNESLNGRFGQYLSECEWFLPGMKHLHTAIEAHLRLMSLDSVASRKESKDHDECLENFRCASFAKEDFKSFNYTNHDLSFYENFNAFLFRKQSRNSIPIYRRSIRKSFESDARDQIIKESVPTSLLYTVAAYRANFYFTAMQCYKESLTECDECFDIMNKAYGVPKCNFSHLPLLICNSLSQIYDEHLRVILGFATLHRNISPSESLNSSTAHEVCLKLDAIEFVKYLRIQCGHKLSVKPVRIFCPDHSKEDFKVPCMSQLVQNDVFSAAILFAALRQSRVSKEHVPLTLIPRYCSKVSYISAFQFSDRMGKYMQNSLTQATTKTLENDHGTHVLKSLDLLNSRQLMGNSDVTQQY